MNLPIVAYHAIGNHSSPLWTPLDDFVQHVEAFARQGYRTVNLGQVAAALKSGYSLPADALVITFDDAYSSVFSKAFPVLKDHGMTATVFAITDYCGKTNKWPGQPPSVPREDLMSFDQLALMSEAGMEVGAHTKTHAALTQLSEDDIACELAGCRDVIQARIGKTPSVFAYPYGLKNDLVMRVTSRYFDCAVATELGMVCRRSPLYALPRLDAYYLKTSMIPHLRSYPLRQYLHLREKLRVVKRLFHSDWQPAATS